MLTSSNPSNQYLRPDYLTPLPTTLDAKNSPLALLAQTCSAIGADSPNPKLLANIEKSTKNHNKSSSSMESSRDKLSPISNQSSSSLSTSSLDATNTTINHHHHNHHQHQQQQQHQHQLLQHQSQSQPQQQQTKTSNFKPYESCTMYDRKTNLTPEDRSSASINLSGGINRIKTPKSHSQSSSTTTNGRCDSNQSATSQRDSPSANILMSRKTPSSLSNSQHEQYNNPSPIRASSKESMSAVIPQESPISRLSGDIPKESNLINPAKTISNSIPSVTSSYFPGYTSGLPYPMDLMTASALMSPHHPMFKAAALGPYLNYARLKGVDPASMMSPVCRDPYCTGCTLSPHMMNKATGHPCPAGCTQCDHQNSKSYQTHGTAAAAYAHAQLAALAAASQLPYVCSWIGGDAAYCGKRFGTSDELFQHLRTHTASMPEAMLNAATAAGVPPTHPLFQRTYPTPPLSPLSTARYHPYSKPSMLPPSLAPPSLASLPMPPHPSLAQYFSPYSLYGPRLGTPPSMHP